ncbi:glycosyltransferase family 4 protein [Pontibacter harenae]|uniref:glycosyltransferase family 4 protein n=1 Tax=Pontibacter harenae TaxID=2894083 RepID=UPI001E541F44|nr:glycosyltransferase family 4 protein [Pontibacter harenae]MCC9168227.1 glycosyltransferase family 4 protein [Pontibacter harenae]
MSKIIVGTHAAGYNPKRNFIDLPLSDYEVQKKKDFLKVPAHVYFKLKKKSHPFLSNLFYDIGLNNVPLYHFFNAINIGNIPWVTTFEHYLPRGAHRPDVFKHEKWYIAFATQRLMHNSCKRMVAMSQFAYDAQLNFLYEYGDFVEELKQKMVVLHPQQPKLIDSIDQKKTAGDCITFTITGSDFFRKGGKEILRVFSKLLDEKQPVKLNIVSDLQFGDYASRATKEDQILAMNIINKYKQIEHYNQLPNISVLEVLRKTDVGLLPTYDETYGYSVLEAQAAGCPVITTNGAALSEINNNDIGWLIEVPLVEDNRSIPRTKEAKEIFSEIVEGQLDAIVRSIIEDRNVIMKKGAKALQRIEEEHCPFKVAKILETIYDAALR